MSLAQEYRMQFAWRAWPEVLALLPPLTGKRVLDLGCGIGDQTAELAARGAQVLGVDSNEELLGHARARGIANAEFRYGDLRALQGVGGADGIWCSFAAAYLPKLSATLASWKPHLRPNAWVALTEVDDLFGHEPLETPTKLTLSAYAEVALRAERYDFHMGRKLEEHLRTAGFTISSSRTLPDREFSFDGVASPDVLAAWQRRFERMTGLQNHCGESFDNLKSEFLATLCSDQHRSLTKVYCCVATL